jgi:glycosyltransferase involved in cell wall biosynthesis
MNRLPLLFVINGLGTGGSERSLAEMLPGMAELGIDPVIACLYRREEGVQEQVRAWGFDVRFLPAGVARRVSALRSILRDSGSVIVHTTHFEADVAGRLASIHTPARVVTSIVNTCYDPVRRGDPSVPRIRLRAVQSIDSQTARHLNAHFHAVSYAAKDAAVQRMGLQPRRITVVERGRDPARLGEPGPLRRSRVRSALGLAEDDKVIINVGRREYAKGQRFLIDAMGILAPRFPNLVCLIAGRDGYLSEELGRMRREYGLEARVRFLGHREDIPDLLAASDVFVISSLYEGLPGAAIEAMALGLPVIGSDIAPTREVVEPGRSGVLVAPASGGAIAAALRELLDRPEVGLRMGREGRAMFLERFTLTRSTERMVELFRRVAGDPGTHSTRVAELSPASTEPGDL